MEEASNGAVRPGAAEIAVCDMRPGIIAIAMAAPVVESCARRAQDGLTPFPRVGTPDEAGAVIATFASGGLPY